MSIVSFASLEAKALFEGRVVARFANIRAVAERKLQQLDSAASLGFLRSPPGNRLEKLSGSRTGQYSIRVNEQWRICFIWTEDGPEQVEIVDYH
jgi:proteic killer suppression protein